MDFDKLLVLFFGTSDLATLPSDQVLAGVERLRTQFGIERDDSQRFAQWCLLYMLGAAPDVEVFEDEADREAALEFMDTADEADEE